MSLKKAQPRTPTQARSIEKRKRIMDAATRVFSEHGLEKATTRLIAKEAEVSVGTFYAYFQDKEDLFRQVFERFGQDVHRQMEEKIVTLFAAGANLEEFSFGLVEVCRSVLLKERGLHRELLLQEIKNPDEWRESAKQDRELWETICERYGHEMALPDPDAAWSLIHLIVTQVVHYILLYPSPLEEDRLFRELGRMIYAYVKK